MDYGPSCIIIPTDQGIIKKQQHRKYKTHDTSIQKRIHEQAYEILKHYSLLQTPRILESEHTYCMERIDTSRPIWLGVKDSYIEYDVNFIQNLKEELARFWNDMWNLGYAPWDFELYVQPSNRVMILDYDKYGLKNGSTLYMYTRSINPQFFLHPCFPKNFSEKVGSFSYQ
jgi:hypothetical protein